MLKKVNVEEGDVEHDKVEFLRKEVCTGLKLSIEFPNQIDNIIYLYTFYDEFN